MITPRQVQSESSKPAKRRRGRPRKNPAPTAVVTVDRPREIRVRQGEPTARPVEGPRRVMVSLSLFALLAAACASLLFGFRSERLRVTELDVNGASPAMTAEIGGAIAPSCAQRSATQAGATRLMCDPNDALLPPILTFDTGALAQQFRRIPAVESASVRAVLPNRLEVTIQERRPEAAWVVGPTVFRVAADGTVLDQGSPDGLKVIIGSVDGPPVKPGDKVDPKTIQAAEELQDRLPRELNIPVKQIQYSATNGLAVISDPHLIAMFGSPDNLGVKMAELQRIVQQAKDKKTPPVFVDVRYKTPYFRTQ